MKGCSDCERKRKELPLCKYSSSFQGDAQELDCLSARTWFTGSWLHALRETLCRLGTRGFGSRSFENDDAERGDRHADAVRAAMTRRVIAVDAALIADVAATIDPGIAVERFLVKASLFDTEPVVVSRDRREIKGNDQLLFKIGRASNVCVAALLPVVSLNPTEAGRFELGFVERLVSPVEMVQIADKSA